MNNPDASVVGIWKPNTFYTGVVICRACGEEGAAGTIVEGLHMACKNCGRRLVMRRDVQK